MTEYVDLTSDQTIGGVKTFEQAPVFLTGLVANVIPRTGTLQSLLQLTNGDGSFATATDDAALVQLNTTAQGGASAYFPSISVQPPIANTTASGPVTITIPACADLVSLSRTTGTPAVTATLDAPADPALVGKTVRVELSGTTSPFTVNGLPLKANQWAQFRWNGAAWVQVANGTNSSLLIGSGSTNFGGSPVSGAGAAGIGSFSTGLLGNASGTSSVGLNGNASGASSFAATRGSARAPQSVAFSGNCWGAGGFVFPIPEFSSASVGSVGQPLAATGVMTHLSGTLYKFATADTADFPSGASVRMAQSPDGATASIEGLVGTVTANTSFTINVANTDYTSAQVLLCTTVFNTMASQGSISKMGGLALNQFTESTGINQGFFQAQTDRCVVSNQVAYDSTVQELNLDSTGAYNGEPRVGISNRWVSGIAGMAYLVMARVVLCGQAGTSNSPSMASVSYQFLLQDIGGTLAIKGPVVTTQPASNHGFTAMPTFAFTVANTNQLVVTMSGHSASDLIDAVCALEMIGAT